MLLPVSRPHAAFMTLAFLGLGLGLGSGGAACVPSGSAPPHDAGAPPQPSISTFRPSINVMTAPFEDNFDRPDGGEAASSPLPLPGPAVGASSALLPKTDARASDGGRGARFFDSTAAQAALGAEAGADAARPSNLGPNWTAARTNAWRIEKGQLCVENAKNHGVWLNRVLPVNARIEFEATAFTDDGDLKTEVWGDGRSYATGTSYTNATSYIAILGGWHNTTHVLARQNEHGKDRKEIRVDKNSDDPRERAVVRGQVYHFKIERTDGKTVRWFVDDLEYLSFVDPAPLAGFGHDHFGFNEWDAKVCFDNVKVTPL